MVENNKEYEAVPPRDTLGHAAVLVKQYTATIRHLTVHLKLYGPAPEWTLVREQQDRSGEVHRQILAIPDPPYLLRFLEADPLIHQLRRGYDEILQVITDPH